MDSEVILLLISAGFLFVGGQNLLKSRHLASNGIITKAVVFKNNYKKSSHNSGAYYPVVRFTTEDDQWITQELDISYFPAKAQGTILEVIYDPLDPSIVEINGTFQMKIIPWIFIILGIVGLTFSVLEYLDIIDFVKSN